MTKTNSMKSDLFTCTTTPPTYQSHKPLQYLPCPRFLAQFTASNIVDYVYFLLHLNRNIHFGFPIRDDLGQTLLLCA